MKHHFRTRLLNGELLIGTMVTLRLPEIAELLAGVGFDWLFVDAEHSTLGPRDVQEVLQGAGVNTPCLIRVPVADELSIKKALDTGAAGIIAPMVNTAAEAEQVVRMAKYAPEGTRGVGIARAHGYGLNFQHYIDSANRDVTVVVQAEHSKAVENIASIVKVPGVDAVLVGPYDLSASLGKLGQVTDPAVTDAINHVADTCQQAGVRLGIFGVSAEAVQPYIERGYTLIIAGVDTLMLGQAAGQMLATLKHSA